MDRLHKGDRIRLTERRHIGDNQYAPAGTTGTVLTGGRFTAQVALDGLRDPYFDRAAQVAVTPNVGQGNSGYELNTPTAALARASARALSQPGAKWTPATGWTDEPIATDSVETVGPEPSSFQLRLHDLAHERVTKLLTGMHTALGPFNREELGSFMDGAQEAVMDWLPITKGPKA